MSADAALGASSGRPLLELRQVEAGYGGQRVLRGVSLAVPEGKVITLVGPNGHGKTTLLYCISGLVRPTAGEIRLDGKPIQGLSVDRIVEQGVVHIPQGDMIFADMSVMDNLLMGAYLPSAAAEQTRRLDEVLTLLPRLAERRAQTASTLSGGERRMLAIGRGLMAGGRILLIDEPSLGLAPIVIEQIYEVIAGLKRTILLVEENVSRVVDLAERVYLLDNGEIVWEGSAAEMADNDELHETYLGG